MARYTIVSMTPDGGEPQEALYADGTKLAEPDGGGKFDSMSLLHALSLNDGYGIQPANGEVTAEWDESVDGQWPVQLADIPADAFKYRSWS